MPLQRKTKGSDAVLFSLAQGSQQLMTLLSLTVAHPLCNRGFLPTGKTNFPGPRVEVV